MQGAPPAARVRTGWTGVRVEEKVSLTAAERVRLGIATVTSSLNKHLLGR